MSKFTMQQLLAMKGDYGTLELTPAGFGYVDRLVHADNAAPSDQAQSSGEERAVEGDEGREAVELEHLADESWRAAYPNYQQAIAKLGLPVAPVASPQDSAGALNRAYNLGAQTCAASFAKRGLLKEQPVAPVASPAAEAGKAQAPCGHLIRDGQTTIGACEHELGHEGEHQRGVRAGKAQAEWTAVDPENLPDSDVTVLLCNAASGARDLGELAFTDDSDGLGEPFWDTFGHDRELHAFTHWKPFGPLPPPPSNSTPGEGGAT